MLDPRYDSFGSYFFIFEVIFYSLIMKLSTEKWLSEGQSSLSATTVLTSSMFVFTVDGASNACPCEALCRSFCIHCSLLLSWFKCINKQPLHHHCIVSLYFLPGLHTTIIHAFLGFIMFSHALVTGSMSLADIVFWLSFFNIFELLILLSWTISDWHCMHIHAKQIMDGLKFYPLISHFTLC